MHEDLSISERIIQALSDGPREKAELKDSLVAEGGITEQGFYKALSQLKEREVVTEHDGALSLSFVWIQKEFDRLSKIASVYNAPAYQTYFGNLQPGEKIIFKFKTLKELEIFWTHVLLVAIEAGHRNSVVLSVMPHDWFERLRPEGSKIWDRLTSAHAKHAVVLTHATSAEAREGEHAGVEQMEVLWNENPFKQKETSYINVIGDLISDARLDEKVVPLIREAMLAERPDASFLDMPGTFKLILERNPVKAQKIKKRLQKYFTIPLLSQPEV